MKMDLINFGLLVIINNLVVSAAYKCFRVDEEVTFCINAETPRLECPVGHRLNIRWAELRRAQAPCRVGVLMSSQKACLMQRVTSHLKAQCDNHLSCEPSLTREDHEVSDCTGSTTNDFLHVWYRCNPESLGLGVFYGMCDTKTVTGPVVHVVSSQDSIDLGCSCTVTVPRSTEIEVLAQQTKEIPPQHECPQTIHVQDGDFSKQYCMPDKMGVVTQVNCHGERHHVTFYYVHITVRGHTLTFKASYNVNLTVTCGPLYLGTPPPSPRTDRSALSSHGKEPSLRNPNANPNDNLEEEQPRYDAAVLGGVVGATMCVILVLSAILIYLLWQRKLEREKARKKAAYHIESGDHSDNDLDDTETITEPISARPTPSTSENFNCVAISDDNESPRDSPNIHVHHTLDGGENCPTKNYQNGVRHKEVLPSVHHHTNNNAAFRSEMPLGATGIDRQKCHSHNQCDTDV